MTDIVVTGKRIRVVVGRRDRNGRRVDSDDLDVTNSAGAREAIQREVSEGEADGDEGQAKVYVAIQIPGLNFEVLIPAEEFMALTDRQIRAMLYVFDNYTQSPQLAAALQHLHNEQISAVELRFDDKVHRHDGTNIEFRPNGNGVYPAAQIEYQSVEGDSTRTNIVQNTKVVITFNKNDKYTMSTDGFIHTLIHELLHPATPDVSTDRWFPDHGQVIPLTETIFNTLFPGGSVSSVIPLPKSPEEEIKGIEVQDSVSAHLDLGYSSAEALALTLYLNTMFGRGYWDLTRPVYVPEPYPQDRHLEE
jgi:hypothetical protein